MCSNTRLSVWIGLALFASRGFAGTPTVDPIDIPPQDIHWATVEAVDASGAAVAGPSSAFHELRVTLSGERTIKTRILRANGRLYQVSLGQDFCLVSPQPLNTSATDLATSVTVTHPVGLTVVATSVIHGPRCGWAATWDKRMEPQTMRCTIPDPDNFCVYVSPCEDDGAPTVNAVMPGEEDGVGGPGGGETVPFDPSTLPDCPTNVPFPPPCNLQCPGPCCPETIECPGPCCPCSGPGCPDTPQGY